ncbi:MAG: TonB-dependent receptor [Prolixibacteraceae bacterium]|nr:TonB-dependent receptor [Prolixibacteraceae bacterium]
MSKKKFLAALFALVVTLGAHAQENNFQEEKSDSSFNTTRNISVGEVVVSSLRVDRKLKELPASIAVLGEYDYQKNSALTISHVLESEPGITMGSDGAWATNINIRGMGESRLVTLVDGNRVETATDLTASLSMIDVNDIERVEIIKGAQSSLYGTGAMGGIVNIITKDGRFANKPYLSGNVISGYASANNLLTGHAAINAGSGNWYLRLSGAYNKADDITTPMGVLPNSQYTANNISAKLGLKPFSNHLFKMQYQRNWATDVGIPGGAAFPSPAEATYTDIGRHLLDASYEIKNLSEKLASLKLSYFYQYILRDVSMVPNTVKQATLPNGNVQQTTPELITPTGLHVTNGGQLQSTWQLTEKNTLIAGLDVWSRKLTTEREKFIKIEVLNPDGSVLITNNIERGETPIPESTFGSAGLFFHDEARLLDDKLTLTLGGRLDGIQVKNEQGTDVDYLIVNGNRNDAPPTQRITFEESTDMDISWSANAGLLYKLTRNVDASLNLARSFRSPSLEERYKYIDLGNLVRLGNPNLDPESGYSADLGIRVWDKKINFRGGLFVNRLTNMVVEKPGEFVYTLTSNVVDTVDALINTNVSKALLYGFDYNFEYNFFDNFVVFNSLSYVRGTDTDTGDNLPLIPPFSGRLGLRYTYHPAGSVEFTAVGAAQQDKVARGEEVTAGYMRFDLALSSAKFDLSVVKLQVFAGIDNLTNTAYTNHLATNRGSISVEPGRNFYVRLNLSF